MHTQTEKAQENKSKLVGNKVSQKRSANNPFFQFEDNRSEAVAQRKLQEVANNSPQILQLKAFQENVKNRKTVIQGMFSTHKATESSMATYLTATLADGPQLCSNLPNSTAGHSEDRFIDEILPANVASLKTTDNVIMLGINRSPCTSTDHCGNGSPSSGKPVGAAGCSERLIHLVTHGFVHGGTTYPIILHITYRNLYGSDKQKEANSAQALHAMTATNRISCETQQLGGPSEQFSGTSAAKIL